MSVYRKIALACALTGVPASGFAAGSRSVAQFYSGNTIQVMIGYSPGGTDDLWARLIAARLGAHMPGRPNVVAVNVPGAGSLLLANQIYNMQLQDGTVVGLINRGLAFEKLLGGAGVKYDPLKMRWIGSPDRATGVCAARKDAPVKTLADLKTKELVVGATGSGADTAVYPQVLSKILGLRFKELLGYPGSHEISLAMERGEVQGECVVYNTLARNPYFQQGHVNVLLQMALTPDPRIKSTPLASSVAQNERDRQALDLFTMRNAIGRPFFVGPEVPADRVAALRKAFAETVRDAEVEAKAEKGGLHPHFISGEKIKQVIDAAYRTPKSAVDRLKQAYGQ